MKKLLIILAIFTSSILNVSAQEYIKKDKTNAGIRTVETYPSIFSYQTEQYLLAWNYISDPSAGVDNYYLAVMCNDLIAPCYVSAGDKLYLGLVLEDRYIELPALMDAVPESYETSTGVKYRTLAYYLIPSSAYNDLYKGFNKFKIDVKVKNSAPVTLAVKMPYSSLEHMLSSYLDIMIATGR